MIKALKRRATLRQIARLEAIKTAAAKRCWATGDCDDWEEAQLIKAEDLPEACSVEPSGISPVDKENL